MSQKIEHYFNGHNFDAYKYVKKKLVSCMKLRENKILWLVSAKQRLRRLSIYARGVDLIVNSEIQSWLTLLA